VLVTCQPGAVSGTWCAGADCPWPVAFPPPLLPHADPPRGARQRRCSAASSVLPVCQTSRARALLADVLRLLKAARHARGDGRLWDPPVLACDVSVHAGVLRPREVPIPLALPWHGMEPSAYGHSVGTFRQVGCRGSLARLHVPLSTLHERPHGRPHMTR